MIKRFLILLILLTASLFAQDKYYYYYWQGVNDGLPIPEIFASNSDTVWSAGARFINRSVDTANSPSGTMEWMNYGPMHRMAQTGDYPYCEFYINGTASNITYWNIRFWRRNNTYSNTDLTMTLVDSTGDLSASLVDGYNKLYFGKNIALQEGDFYSVQAVFSAANVIAFTTNNQNPNNPNPEIPHDTCKYQTYFETNLTSKVWLTDTNYAQVRAFPIRFYCIGAPIFVIGGDSMFEGNYHVYQPQHVGTTIYNNLSFVGVWTNINKTYHVGWDKTQTVGRKIADYFGYTYQNVGRGGWTSQSIMLTVDSNIIKKRPRFVLINGGLNNGSTASVTITNQMKSTIYRMTSAHIPVIALAITPSWVRQNSFCIVWDTVNQVMADWVADCQTDSARWWVQWVNLNSALGVQRDTGTPTLQTPNYWDIKEEYSDDYLHFNNTGATLVADSLKRYISNMFDTVRLYVTVNPQVDSAFPVLVSANVYAQWGIDSMSYTYTVNGGASAYGGKLVLDSGSIWHGTYILPWLLDTAYYDPGDVILYTVTAYEKSSSRTASATGIINVDEAAPSPVLGGLVLAWFKQGLTISPISRWLNTQDTFQIRQGTAANRPTILSGALFDSTDGLSATIPFWNDSLTFEMGLKITDTASVTAQRIFSYRKNSAPYIQIVSFEIGTNALNKFSTAHYQGVGYNYRCYRTSEVTGWLGNTTRFTLEVDTTNRQNLFIDNTQLAIFTGTCSPNVNAANYFAIGEPTTGGMKGVTVAYFMIYNRKLTAAEKLINQAWHDYYY